MIFLLLRLILQEMNPLYQFLIFRSRPGGCVGFSPLTYLSSRCEVPRLPTSRDCHEAGGVEYWALTLLSYIVSAYFVLFQLCGCIGLGWWISVHMPDIPLRNGLNPWWMGAFNAVSAFNNFGMSLLDKNMVFTYYIVIPCRLFFLLIYLY